MQAAITAGSGSGIIKLKNSIPTGRENAIKTRDLMQLNGYLDKRKLRMDIRRLRIEGEVILSSTQKGGGYYRPKDKEELRRFIRQEENRAKSIFYSLKTARKLLKEEPQSQMSFSDAETTPTEKEEKQ